MESITLIQKQRLLIWNRYYQHLKDLEKDHLVALPFIPGYATNNGHMFYLVCKSVIQRDMLIRRLRENNILAVFHYLSLHNSNYYREKHDGRCLPVCDAYSDKLLRLPFYFELNEQEQLFIIDTIIAFFRNIE